MFVASYWSDLATTTVSNARRPPHAQTDTRTAASRRENDSLHNHDAFKLSNFQNPDSSTIDDPTLPSPCIFHTLRATRITQQPAPLPPSPSTTQQHYHAANDTSIDRSIDGWMDRYCEHSVSNSDSNSNSKRND